jgi:UPF0755 protein
VNWKRTFGCILLVLLLGGLAAGAAGWWAWRTLETPYRGYSGEERIVLIGPGTPSVHILERLEAEGVVRDATLTRLWLVYGLGNPPLQAGEYRFTGAADAGSVLDKLIEGDVRTHRVTIVEGLSMDETAAALAAAGLGGIEAFLAAIDDASPIADLDPAATNLEGYLFPSTYHFPSGTSEAEIVATLVETFRRQWSEHVAPVDSERAPATVRGVVTLASLVEEEARLAAERPTIAAVYANRLERGMGLYADPTVIYAMKLEGTWDGNIRRSDLRMDHPYNTYVHPGLPPGPIASPGLASLRAAADPADEPYLYFVSRNDGSHVFSRTLAEHNENVARWQKRYWRERWAEERRAEERRRQPDDAAPPPD